MNLLRNAKVRTKLFFMTGTFICSLIIVGLIGYYYLQISNDKIKYMYNSKLLAIEYLQGSQINYNASNRDLFELMVTTDINRKSEIAKDMSSEKELVMNFITSYTNTKPDSPEEIDNMKQLNENFSQADQMKVGIVSLAEINMNTEAYSVYNKNLSPINEKIEKNISFLVNYNITEAKKLYEQNQADFNSAQLIILAIIVFTLVLGSSIAIFIINLIVKPIKSFVVYIGKVALGDLSKDTLKKAADVKLYKDEIGKLGHSIIDMRGNLWKLLTKVSEATELIASSSQQLNANAEESSMGIEATSKAVNKIGEGIETQLKTVLETSDVIQQMSGITEQVATNTADTARISEKTLNATNEGGKAIKTATEQMNNIEDIVGKLDGIIKVLGARSSEIGQIVQAISGIAEQTNLLALNAAIEAARAGEQGRGFAVVASEVRKLAENSKKSTEEIATLIGQIQLDTDSAITAMNAGTNQVRIGKEVVDKAGQAFGDITKLVQEIASQIQEVSTATDNIADGSQQVVTSINKVDEISQDVSRQSQKITESIEEQTSSIKNIASSSEGLAKIGESLMLEISKFKL
ncbi:MAG TPA: HAMP domain-containing methyl-accepting chemotaxis protein [Clostridiaceae bacterium]